MRPCYFSGLQTPARRRKFWSRPPLPARPRKGNSNRIFATKMERGDCRKQSPPYRAGTLTVLASYQELFASGWLLREERLARKIPALGRQLERAHSDYSAGAPVQALRELIAVPQSGAENGIVMAALYVLHTRHLRIQQRRFARDYGTQRHATSLA